MRVMILAKNSPQTEHELPASGDWEPMARFHEELAKAGVLIASDRLAPSDQSARVRFGTTERTVIDGPFTESKELVAGFWIWQVRSLDEAIEWLKRAPFDAGTELEVRPIMEFDVPGAGSPATQGEAAD